MEETDANGKRPFPLETYVSPFCAQDVKSISRMTETRLKNMNRMILVVVTVLLFVMSAAAQENVSPEQRIESYFKAFNSGDADVMRKYFESNFADTGVPLEERVRRYDSIRKQVGKLELEEVKVTDRGEANAVARAANGDWLLYTFQFEPQPPHRIVGISVEGEDSRPDLSTGATRKTTNEELVVALGKYLNDLASEGRFSGVVLVAGGNKPLFEKAYGMANLSFKIPNRIDTKFNLGSINKIFTQIAIGQLLQQKKLKLDDPVGKHYPDYANRDVADRVTIRHLVEMTSGMGDIFNEKYDAIPKERLRSLMDFLPLFVADPLQFEPGSRNQYSNAGYVLLGLLIEKISGQDYYEYIQRNIFEPAGMTHSAYFESDAPVENLAEGYTRDGCDANAQSCRKRNIYFRPARGSSAGGGYSTAQDLLLFANVLRENKLLPAENPLSIRNRGMAGGAPGTNALLDLLDGNYTVIVLSNYDPPIAEQIGKQIRAWLPRS
jgi:CubicO group peptidase (beta-lactamase class C family)